MSIRPFQQNYKPTLRREWMFFQEKVKGKYVSATLVSAKTGEIPRTTQRPSYNADTKQGLDLKNLKTWNTILYQDQYEPGSTMKVMLLASAIDHGTFPAYNEVYYSNELQVKRCDDP